MIGIYDNKSKLICCNHKINWRNHHRGWSVLFKMWPLNVGHILKLLWLIFHCLVAFLISDLRYALSSWYRNSRLTPIKIYAMRNDDLCPNIPEVWFDFEHATLNTYESRNELEACAITMIDKIYSSSLCKYWQWALSIIAWILEWEFTYCTSWAKWILYLKLVKNCPYQNVSFHTKYNKTKAIIASVSLFWGYVKHCCLWPLSHSVFRLTKHNSFMH